MSTGEGVIPEAGSYVAEYFGYQVYPNVAGGPEALDAQQTGCCPFLSMATGEARECVKGETSRGVCTVSSVVDEVREDWLVCPNRAIDPTFMGQAARRLFGYAEAATLHFIAAPTLSDPETREIVKDAVAKAEHVLVYFQEKLGGELGISKTSVSPEFSFDWTLVEVLGVFPELSLGRFGILELQTMDFHGSYRHAVSLMRSELEINPDGFHEYLRTEEGRSSLSEKMETPNLSNVFKRTFYQMVYKFQLAGHSNCAGGGFAVPRSVWTSWARHLANPSLLEQRDGTFVLGRGDGDTESLEGNSWIFVFELDKSNYSRNSGTPNVIRPWRVIKTDAETLIQMALRESPAQALADGSPIFSVTERARQKIRRHWPAVVPRNRRRSQGPTLF
ncbi:hypothetical protein ABZ767_31750 [Streptomyces pseudogriseolus]|uniref:hypothetical protein n=1 Tax=Streptomyces pseudogriseolus TaxID=36817 RepID=UPI003498F6F5